MAGGVEGPGRNLRGEPNAPFKKTVTAQMPNGKSVKIAIDSNQQLSEAEINVIIRKVQALGKIYVIGGDRANTKSFALEERGGGAKLIREKIVGNKTEIKPPIIAKNFEELLNVREGKIKAKHQSTLDLPENQHTDQTRIILAKVSEKIAAVAEARRIYGGRGLQSQVPAVAVQAAPVPAQVPDARAPVLPAPVPQAPIQQAPIQNPQGPRHPPVVNQNNFEVTVEERDKDQGIPGKGHGKLHNDRFDFEFTISSPKDLTEEQLEAKLSDVTPVMGIYARFLEVFPTAVVTKSKRPISDFKKFVKGELDKKERELRKRLADPHLDIGDEYDLVTTLKKELRALPKDTSKLRFWNNRFSFEIAFQKKRLPESVYVSREIKKTVENLLDRSIKLKDFLNLKQFPESEQFILKQADFAQKSSQFILHSKQLQGEALLAFMNSDEAKEFYDSLAVMGGLVSGLQVSHAFNSTPYEDYEGPFIAETAKFFQDLPKMLLLNGSLKEAIDQEGGDSALGSQVREKIEDSLELSSLLCDFAAFQWHHQHNPDPEPAFRDLFLKGANLNDLMHKRVSVLGDFLERVEIWSRAHEVLKAILQERIDVVERFLHHLHPLDETLLRNLELLVKDLKVVGDITEAEKQRIRAFLPFLRWLSPSPDAQQNEKLAQLLQELAQKIA